MNPLKSVFSIYKRARVVRFLAQILLLTVVYFSVRAWQGRHDIQGLAPIIQGVQLNGEVFNLEKYRGAPVLVHFWATWCAVCRFESKNIAALAEDYPVITVATWVEDEKAVEAYLQQAGLDMPVIVDTDQRWARKYAIKAVPYSFIIDSNGYIRYIEKGYSTEAGLRLRMWWAGMNPG
ncbi:MAG TPA: redoxin domain-containing protein [Gammaproteobacteria bacterium]|nr:redoxin domain-containing protein [Gammaproteobacteria bacterium]